jgi:adenylosuccinate lyase
LANLKENPMDSELVSVLARIAQERAKAVRDKAAYRNLRYTLWNVIRNIRQGAK